MAISTAQTNRQRGDVSSALRKNLIEQQTSQGAAAFLFVNLCFCGEVSHLTDFSKLGFSGNSRYGLHLTYGRGCRRLGIPSTCEIDSPRHPKSQSFVSCVVRYVGLCSPGTDKPAADTPAGRNSLSGACSHQVRSWGVVSLEGEAVSRKPEVFRGQPRSEIVALLFSKRANSHHVCRGDDSVGYLKTPLSRKERVKGEAEVSHDQLGIEIIGFSLQPSQQPTRLREGALCRVSAWRDYFRARSGVGVRRGSVKMA